MAATKEHKEAKAKKEKKEKKDKSETKKSTTSEEKKSKKSKKSQQEQSTTFSLLADARAIDSNLSSLFAAKPAPVQPRNLTLPDIATADEDADESADSENEISQDPQDVEQEGESSADDLARLSSSPSAPNEIAVPEVSDRKRKRKRQDADDNLEAAYMQKLAREDEKESKRHKSGSQSLIDRQLGEGIEDGGNDQEEEVDAHSEGDEDEEMMSPPPRHETLQAPDDDLAKASRTVFLGNVSTTAINSKTARKTLMNHLASFFSELPTGKLDESKPKVESIRFRSTPYSSAIPKKAAFAKKELMDATTKSTNAYAVYSSQMLAREAAKRLNGTVVLDRHLRVDEVAHPAKVDNRRCVFVGNLGFVDDESNIQDANEEEGREKRKRSKIPADAEEGLWRTFGKCGKVESVRVIRDSTTRVGKGIAYVQFDDENAVEAALLLNEKKFPPMLPRKLRVTRAKAQKKNAKPGSGRPSSKPTLHSYQRKVTGAELTSLGRAEKLFGRAAAAQAVKRGGPASSNSIPHGIKKPENFIFEGHRASSKSGKSGLKLGRKGKSKPANRSAKRGAAFKAAKKRA